MDAYKFSALFFLTLKDAEDYTRSPLTHNDIAASWIFFSLEDTIKAATSFYYGAPIMVIRRASLNCEKIKLLLTEKSIKPDEFIYVHRANQNQDFSIIHRHFR